MMSIPKSIKKIHTQYNTQLDDEFGSESDQCGSLFQSMLGVLVSDVSCVYGLYIYDL